LTCRSRPAAAALDLQLASDLEVIVKLRAGKTWSDTFCGCHACNLKLAFLPHGGAP